MPTYQYACTECDHAFEQVQSFNEDSLTVCPQCEGRLRKVFNAVGVVFKGSGFYRTDSRTDSRPDKGPDKRPAKGTDGASTAATASAAKSESASTSTGSTRSASGSSSSTSTDAA